MFPEDQEEKLYTESEVVQILVGLDNVYYSKPWHMRLLFKPWHDALQTAAMIGGGKMLVDYENEQLFESITKNLGYESNESL